MKKLISSILFFVLLLSTVKIDANALSAKAAVLIDADTQRVIYQKNKDIVLPMASTTKIMTAIVTIENFELDNIVTVSKKATLIEGSSMYLKENEKITIYDLLCGLMLMSGNDAAHALDEAFLKSGKNLVELMNKKAKALGLKNTSFENASGLDANNHKTTAYELSLIMSYAMQNESFRDITSLKSCVKNQRYMRNHNKLLWTLDGVNGGKTGFTKKSGRCLVSSTKRNGRQLIAVTLNAPDDWSDHKKMITDGFAEFKNKLFIEKEQKSFELQIAGQKKVLVKNESELSIYLTDDEKAKIKQVVYLPKFIFAPVLKGEKAGRLLYKIEGKTIAQTELVYDESIEQTQKETKSMLDKIKEFLNWR